MDDNDDATSGQQQRFSSRRAAAVMTGLWELEPVQPWRDEAAATAAGCRIAGPLHFYWSERASEQFDWRVKRRRVGRDFTRLELSGRVEVLYVCM